ncbi:hypothetical protein H4R33_003241 [Dimargaris cristalligena]|nr:hypothetical protein H4R33_003241 [Dimargaris cristalligena]
MLFSARLFLFFVAIVLAITVHAMDTTLPHPPTASNSVVTPTVVRPQRRLWGALGVATTALQLASPVYGWAKEKITGKKAKATDTLPTA